MNEVPQPDPEVLQKANLAAGEMYDLLQKRDLAVKRYQAVIATDASTPFAQSANRYLKEPYAGEWNSSGLRPQDGELFLLKTRIL